MACFLVPAGEAVITTVVQKVVSKKEKGVGGEKTEHRGAKWSQRLGWLNKLLWGGSIMLCLEHIWHGEVVPWPPFLTAMDKPGETGPMVHEIITFGIPMAIAVTVVWAIMVVFVELRAKATKNMPEVKAHTVDGDV